MSGDQMASGRVDPLWGGLAVLSMYLRLAGCLVPRDRIILACERLVNRAVVCGGVGVWLFPICPWFARFLGVRDSGIVMWLTGLM